MAVVHEQQITDVSWYSQPLDGTAKDNFHRIIELRKAFCHPLTINKDGTLNSKYFSNESKETAMNWTDIEMMQLLEGIYLFGVDSVEKWIQIQAQKLPQRDFIEVRLKLSQMLGTQDLAKYAGTKFTSEKQIEDEFEKNKAAAIKDGSWHEESNVALKPEVAKLSRADIKQLEREELAHWKEVVYENPCYIYRTNSTRTSSKASSKGSSKSSSKSSTRATSTDAKSGKGGKKKAAKKENAAQSNTLDKYTKKLTEKKVEVPAVQKKVEEQEQEQVKETPKVVEKPQKQNKTKKEKKPKKSTKKAKKPKKGVPALPESSDDEDMLCVE